jgi:hypothetical protein
MASERKERRKTEGLCKLPVRSCRPSQDRGELWLMRCFSERLHSDWTRIDAAASHVLSCLTSVEVHTCNTQQHQPQRNAPPIDIHRNSPRACRRCRELSRIAKDSILRASPFFGSVFAPTPLGTMISGVLFFNQKGENLIFRQFRNDCKPPLDTSGIFLKPS